MSMMEWLIFSIMDILPRTLSFLWKRFLDGGTHSMRSDVISMATIFFVL